MNRAMTAGAVLLVVAAAVIGLYGRFQGIGTWPLGVDEFYISRSIDFILSSGLPKFPCGGYYTRGLLFQYLVAALRRLSLTPEFAARLLAGIGSLAVLPAAYLLGQRVHGVKTGWLVVVVLLLSIWEIEMARFGRMYAPFQAIFCCYLVLYLRYTLDDKTSALYGMVCLSFIGVLTWEGGTLLGVANIFALLQMHERGRLRDGDWRRFGVLVVVLALLFLASRDLRDVGTTALASTSEQAPAAPPTDALNLLRMHWPWGVAFLIPLALAASSARFISSFRPRWMTCAGLSLMILAALAHAYIAVGGLFVLMLLLDLVTWQEVAHRPSRYFAAALVGTFLFWLAYYASTGANPFIPLFNEPDLLQRIARPWARTMPLMTVTLLASCIYWFTLSNAPRANVGKHLLALLIVLVLAVSAIPTIRIETRYTFFLYPLLIVLAVGAVARTTQDLTAQRRTYPGLSATIVLILFCVSEDFQIRQIAHIDSADVNFRVGMTPARADHYYPRNDMRGIAQWLKGHVAAGDVVISGIPNLDQYYRRIDYFFLEEDDNRYDAYVCADGRTERWTGHTVLEKIDDRLPVDPLHHLYATVYPEVQARLASAGRQQGWSTIPVFTSLDGKTQIVSLVRSAPPGTL